MAGNLNPAAGNANIAAGISNMAGAAVLTTLPTLDDAKADRVGKLLSEDFWKRAMRATPETQYLDAEEQDLVVRILRAQEVPTKYTQHNQWKLLRAYIEGESAAIPTKTGPYICVVLWRMKHCLGQPSAGFHGPTVEALSAKGLTVQDLIQGDQQRIRAAVPLSVRIDRLETMVQALEIAGSPAGNNHQVRQPPLDSMESKIRALELEVEEERKRMDVLTAKWDADIGKINRTLDQMKAQFDKETGERDNRVAECLLHVQGFLSGTFVGYTPIEILLGRFNNPVPSKRPGSAQQSEVEKKAKTEGL